jgi:hypothetical protein
MTRDADARDLLRLTQERTVIAGTSADLLDAAASFRERGYIKLSSFLGPSLLASILDAVDSATFYEREHHGIGKELCATPGPVTGVLELLMNDPTLFDVVRQVAGCPAIGCFRGRLYRLAPSTGHYDSWHDDVGETRLLACAINLGRETFDGGELQIRRAGAAEILSEVHNTRAGDAVIFRVDPALQHRVTPVRGTTPRTAYAGWFCAEPSFRDELVRTLGLATPP